MKDDTYRSIRAAVVTRMLAQKTLTQELSAAIVARLPELRDTGPAMRRTLEDMCRHVIQVTVGGLVDLKPCPPPPPTSPTLAFARRMGERGLPAYRTVLVGQIAQRWLMNRMMAELRSLLLEPASMDLIVPMVNWQLACFSVLDDAVGEQHMMAQERTRAAVGGVAPEDVAFALEVAEDEGQIEQILKYSLRARHMGMVVWSQYGTVRGNRLVAMVRSLVQLVPVRDVLVSPRDAVSVDAWIALDGPVRQATTQVTRTLRKGGLRVSFGEPAEGLTGFRTSHQQAVAAYRVGQFPGSMAAPAVRYRDIAVTSLLSKHPDESEPWVLSVLGELAIGCDERARLRETLRVYLEQGENASAAATRLSVHRNTVKYRVARAIDQLAVPFELNRLIVAVALNYHHHVIGDQDRDAPSPTRTVTADAADRSDGAHRSDPATLSTVEG